MTDDDKKPEETPETDASAESSLEQDPVEEGEVGNDDLAPEDPADTALSEADEALLSTTAADIVAEMRTDMLRAQAELVNFRQRVERDRAANRDAVIAEVLRAFLPALDDLSRAEKHGDLAGGPLELVANKIRGGFERFGLTQIGEQGEEFDPHVHEAVVQLPTPGATGSTVADVIDPGYKIGERVIRAAKVAVAVPAE
ncbi:nucleotide exchange factor GrpE [Galbitalea sp. SE-J8]|uniref:nucleotide exchange factor GrpE n=1 Tax=Galbitalea sp. SE-J8 TaxID=3054952 RepID=UPI00259C85A7|nr:nucleotide exchange factor GrpE [Galbitalea sp. SE-J8]MDM4762284.1 nucleotide exchange factor GrpE [Galbitalea sp. SE-J8]